MAFFMFKRNRIIKPCSEEDRVCALCEHATGIAGSGICVCELKGAVREDGVCKKFSFDLLKLNPRVLKLPETDLDFVDLN